MPSSGEIDTLFTHSRRLSHYLDGIGKKLVQLRDLGRDAVIDGLFANFDNDPPENVWVDLCGDFQFLALAVWRFGDSCLETLDCLRVDVL